MHACVCADEFGRELNLTMHFKFMDFSSSRCWQRFRSSMAVGSSGLKHCVCARDENENENVCHDERAAINSNQSDGKL
jgi:hypothetical protein